MWHQIQILQKFKIRFICDTRANFNLVLFGAMLSITSRKTTVKNKTVLCIFSISLCRDSEKWSKSIKTLKSCRIKSLHFKNGEGNAKNCLATWEQIANVMDQTWSCQNKFSYKDLKKLRNLLQWKSCLTILIWCRKAGFANKNKSPELLEEHFLRCNIKYIASAYF